MPPDKYVEILRNVVAGADGAPRTKELYTQAYNMFKDMEIDNDRIFELTESLRQMRAAGKTPEDINEQIKIFQEMETSKFLPRALESVRVGQGVPERDVKDIIKAGAAGKLDNYFIQRYNTDAYILPNGSLGGYPDRFIVGDDGQMINIMTAVEDKARKEISRLTGVPVEEVSGRMAADRSGDEKGYYEFEARGETLRLNVDKKNRYVVEKLEDGRWKKADIKLQIDSPNYTPEEARYMSTYKTPAEQAEEDRKRYEAARRQ
jgi:hypothetical protein